MAKKRKPKFRDVTAITKGYLAGYEGKSRMANPYKTNTVKYHQWFMGHDNGRGLYEQHDR